MTGASGTLLRPVIGSSSLKDEDFGRQSSAIRARAVGLAGCASGTAPIACSSPGSNPFYGNCKPACEGEKMIEVR